MKKILSIFITFSFFGIAGVGFADPGTEGASFLNIPVGAEPAALGSAYSSLAENAYAPVWNAAGLGRVEQMQLAAQHLAYLESIHYEFASFVMPLRNKSAFGVSIQYLGTGDIAATDANGNSIGATTNQYGAYSVAYGRSLSDRLSLGLTGKFISGHLDNVGASAYALDFGSMYRVSERLNLAATIQNVGSRLKFISQSDPLPLAAHVGGTYAFLKNVSASAEAVIPQTKLVSFRGGLEWKPANELALRIGYRTDTIKQLGPIAGLTMGVGFNLLGQELSYAWVPLDELGNTHYFSLLMRFNDHKNR